MTILPLRYWLLVGLVVFTSGCASPDSLYTTRNCIITLAQRVGETAFAANLICEHEAPYKEGAK